MKLLVTGSRGQLGRALERVAPSAGHTVVGVDLPELDVTDRATVIEFVGDVKPDVIVNCAAFTAVDLAEEREGAATAVNGDAVGYLADAANVGASLLVHISTDYVFDGRTDRPYRENDPVAPLSAYGRSKLAGEQMAAAARRHLVVRTAWLYGEGNNFVTAILRQIESGSDELRVVDDQWGNPTFADDLAGAILGLLAVGAVGIVHAVNEGSTTWCGLAREIVRATGGDAPVIAVSTGDVPRPAPRPRYSVLDTEKLTTLLGSRMAPWQDALARFLRGREGGELNVKRV